MFLESERERQLALLRAVGALSFCISWSSPIPLFSCLRPPKMMPMRTKSQAAAAAGPVVMPSAPLKDSPSKIPLNEPAKWEVRPSGMLVQKRSSDEGAAIPTIRLRVKHGSICHEVNISSQATFGELKKLLAERTGLHPLDQKISFKERVRDSAAFLDMSGVKDRSKMAVVEDPAAQAKRLLEVRRSVKKERAAKAIYQISLEVSKLAFQVSALKTVIFNGGKVAENQVVRLIELLMNELLKLDGVAVNDDVKLQRSALVRRVQSYVETLDLIRLKNTLPKAYNGQTLPPEQQTKKQSPPFPQFPSEFVTTKLEAFRSSLFSPQTSASTTATASSTATSSANPTPRLDWELF